MGCHFDVDETHFHLTELPFMYPGNPKTLVFSMPLFDLHPEVCSVSTPWVVQVSNFELAKFWLGTLIQTYFAICLPIACQMMVKYVPPTRKKHRTANSTIGHIFPYFEICSYMFSSLSCHEVLSRQPLERQGTCQITVWLNKFWGREDLTEDLFETWNPSEECKAELKAWTKKWEDEVIGSTPNRIMSCIYICIYPLLCIS